MQFDIRHEPAYSVLVVEMDQGERLNADPGAMLSRSESVEADTSAGGGGVTGTLKRAVSDERQVITNEFECHADGGSLTLAPDEPGDIVRMDLSETGPILVQDGNVLAWTSDVEKSTTMNEAGGFLSTGELTVLELSGTGTVFLGATGSIYSRDVTRGDALVADEDHLVAWTDGLGVDQQRDSSIKSSILGGEGFVTRFDAGEGGGRVWFQTRDPFFFGSYSSD